MPSRESTGVRAGSRTGEREYGDQTDQRGSGFEPADPYGTAALNDRIAERCAANYF